MDEAFFLQYISPYLISVSQNALVTAIAARAERRDSKKEHDKLAASKAHERAKSLSQRIEQKLLGALSSLPSDEAAARALAKEMGDPVFLGVLTNQLTACNFKSDSFLDAWIGEHPELESQRAVFAPFITHYLRAVASEIAGDQEISNLLNLEISGEILASSRRIETALLPPNAKTRVPLIPSLEELRKACAIASKALLEWPTDINGQRMESPLFEELIKPRLPNQTNIQFLLGEPGCGKSALSARLGDWFLKNGSLVLAIKSDQLQSSIDSVAALGAYLGLGESPAIALKRLVETIPVVVIIDQLDALANLVDLHGGRLNAVILFIRELDDLENLRVIASSREVEFRHDARLTTIDAEPIHLLLPEWEEVQALLAKRNIPARNWPLTFREILRRPQQLAVFLKLLKSGEEAPIFNSYQEMLEKLWAQRVTNADGVAGRAELLSEMAMQMAKEETLWLARARFDNHPAEIIDQLIGAGILSTAEDERRIGFQHQTVFDFTVARSFAKGNQGLTDFVLSKQQSLFVRPRLWSALVYLRGAEPHTYRHEFASLWGRTDLRYHIQLQLVEFLGHLESPDQREEAFFRVALLDTTLLKTALVAIIGKQKWFELLAPDLIPQLMLKEKAISDLVSYVLSSVAKHQAGTVLSLLQYNWIAKPEMDWLTASVLSFVNPWNELATYLAETIAARSDHNSQIFDVITFVSETNPAAGIRIFAAYLRPLVDQIEAKSSDIESVDDNDQISLWTRNSPRHRAADETLQGHQYWPDPRAMAEGDPSVFLKFIWPLFLRLIACSDDKDHPIETVYKRELCLGLNDLNGSAPLVEAIGFAAEKLAQTDESAFLSFLDQARNLNSMTVQRILARGLRSIGVKSPVLSLNFLLEDERRFSLGDYHGQQRDSIALIKAASPHLLPEQIASLEKAIGKWKLMRIPHPDVEPEVNERLTEKGRLSLLMALPEHIRSSEVTAAIETGKTKYPDLVQAFDESGDYSPHFHQVERECPMPTNIMEEATDEAILATLAKFPDRTEWQNPIDRFEDNSFSISQAFAELARKQPQRVVDLMRKLDLSNQSRPVEYALPKLVESALSTEILFSTIQYLDKKGLKTLNFRSAAAESARNRISKNQVLPDSLFSIFEGWLPEMAAEMEINPSEDVEDKTQNQTLLWQHNYAWNSPHGTYPVLSALDAACRASRQPEKYLQILVDHVERQDHVATWRAICWQHLVLIGHADPEIAGSFMMRLFERFPQVRDSVAGLRATAEAFRWLPERALKSILQGIKASTWVSSERAFGELVMHRHAHWEDGWVAEMIEILLADSITSQEVLTGLATSASHAFLEPRARSKASTVLRAVWKRAEPNAAVAVLELFQVMSKIEPEREILALLNEIKANPKAFASDAFGPLIERLPDLIPSQSVLVAEFANQILERGTSALLDARNSFAAYATELVNLALALHRDDGAGRDLGLNLFERLLSLDVAGTRQSLLAVDSRPVVGGAAHAPRGIPRLRRKLRPPSLSFSQRTIQT